MSAFPRLKTGAVLQYPARRAVAYRTEVLRFVDGSEQRFRERGGALHSWRVHLNRLDEQELHALADFFRSMQGKAGFFSFEDPWDGRVYPQCSFDQDELTTTLDAALRGRAWLAIREERP